MAKKAFVYDGTQWVDIAQSTVDLSAYQTKANTGLQLVKTQTITSGVSSVSVTSCFNSTFDAYKIVFTGVTTASAAGTNLQFGTSNTGYYSNTISLPAGYSSSGTVGYVGNNNGASFFTEMVTHSTSGSGGTIEVQNPFAATTTTFQSHGSDPRASGVGLRMNSGFHNVATSYTDLTFFVGGTTFTGGRISVYGYAK